MSQSKELKSFLESIDLEQKERLIRMGWEDRTPFEAIRAQYGLSPNEFVRIMRYFLDAHSFKRWRRRIHEQGHLKNEKKAGITIERFKCRRQTVDGLTKGWK